MSNQYYDNDDLEDEVDAIWTDESCNQLLIDKGKLTDRVQELEAQIEKMKCCDNCMWSDCDGKFVNPPCKYCDFNNNKWE